LVHVSATRRFGNAEHPTVCEFCGCPIDEPDERCPALDDGKCRP